MVGHSGLLFQSLNAYCTFRWLQSEYPKYTPLLAKILEGLLAQKNVEDKMCHYEEVSSNSNAVSFVVIFHILPLTKEKLWIKCSYPYFRLLGT